MTRLPIALNRSDILSKTMLACFLKGPGKAVVEETPVPKTGAGDVLVRLKAGGICGTDLEKLHGGYGPGGILGHEVSGTVEKIGPNVNGISVGNRVTAHHHVPCYKCYHCQHGDHTMCDTFKTTNFDPCGFAELFRVPETNVSKGAIIQLPDTVSFEEAALLEPTACCIRALDKANPKPGDNVLIVGLGPTGLTHLQLLRHMKAGKVIGTDIIETRLNTAKQMGADMVLNPSTHNISSEVKHITGQGVDLAIVSTGNPKAMAQAVESVRKGGKVLLFGAPAHGASFALDVSSLFSRQVSIITSYSCVEPEIERALALVSQRAIDPAAMITDRFPLKETTKALEFAGTSKATVKTMIIQ